ncbi:hypothetical protein AB8A28_19875 [Tardiphaga sp. 71_E8_N1_1]|uniref:hypothetical protein n=1 Tax=Tardiphaga sp. 71_E8_N1_1 TaxID=3240784 RepID=UPI003F8B540C
MPPNVPPWIPLIAAAWAVANIILSATVALYERRETVITGQLKDVTLTPGHRWLIFFCDWLPMNIGLIAFFGIVAVALRYLKFEEGLEGLEPLRIPASYSFYALSALTLLLTVCEALFMARSISRHEAGSPEASQTNTCDSDTGTPGATIQSSGVSSAVVIFSLGAALLLGLQSWLSSVSDQDNAAE